MRKAYELPEDVTTQIKSLAATLRIPEGRLVEVFLRRGLTSKEPIVLSGPPNVTSAAQFGSKPAQIPPATDTDDGPPW